MFSTRSGSLITVNLWASTKPPFSARWDGWLLPVEFVLFHLRRFLVLQGGLPLPPRMACSVRSQCSLLCRLTRWRLVSISGLVYQCMFLVGMRVLWVIYFNLPSGASVGGLGWGLVSLYLGGSVLGLSPSQEALPRLAQLSPAQGSLFFFVLGIMVSLVCYGVIALSTDRHDTVKCPLLLQSSQNLS